MAKDLWILIWQTPPSKKNPQKIPAVVPSLSIYMYFLIIVYTTLLKNKIGLKKRPEHCTSVASLDSFYSLNCY